VAARKKTIMKGSGGRAPVKMKPGGLHESLGVPKDQPIPAAKMAEAKAGKHGPLAQKQANMATGMLAKGRKTAAKKGK